MRAAGTPGAAESVYCAALFGSLVAAGSVGGCIVALSVAGVGSAGGDAPAARVGVGWGTPGKAATTPAAAEVIGGVGGGMMAAGSAPAPPVGDPLPQLIINRESKKRYTIFLRIL
jgi:hypothetical protein